MGLPGIDQDYAIVREELRLNTMPGTTQATMADVASTYISVVSNV